MRKKLIVKIAVSLGLFLLPALALADVTVQFSGGTNVNVIAGSSTTITGSITNTGSGVVYVSANVPLSLSGGQSSGSGALTLDPATTDYLPPTLDPGQIYQGPLVTLDASANASPAGYLGDYYLVGGASANGTSTVANLFFNVQVLAATTTTASGVTATTAPIDYSNFVGLQMQGDGSSGGSSLGSGSSSGGLQMPQSGSGNSASGDQSSGSYPNGPRLIRLSADPTVYWVSPNDIKIPMTSAKVFLSYHNKWSDVQTVGQDEFDSYPSAMFVEVTGNPTLYLINNGTLQAIPGDIWVSSEIDASQIVGINKTDFSSYKIGPDVTSVDQLGGQ